MQQVGREEIELPRLAPEGAAGLEGLHAQALIIVKLRARIEKLEHAPIAPLRLGLGYVVHPSPLAVRMGMGGIEGALGIDIHPSLEGKARLRTITLGAELIHGRLQGHLDPAAKLTNGGGVLLEDVALRVPTIAVGPLDALRGIPQSPPQGKEIPV